MTTIYIGNLKTCITSNPTVIIPENARRNIKRNLFRSESITYFVGDVEDPDINSYTLFIYAGRPTIVGNPFVVGKPYSRTEAYSKYYTYINNLYINRNKMFIRWLNDINRFIRTDDVGDVYIMCWCYPKLCHTEILKDIIDRYINV